MPTNFNEFAEECYAVAKSKGFHDKKPNQLNKSAAVRFLQIIVTAAKDFEAERKRDYVKEFLTIQEDDSREARALIRTALLATELAEAAEWALENDLDDQTEYHDSCFCFGKDRDDPKVKPEGFGSELADLAIRLGDMVTDIGVDMDYEIDRKMKYNRTREYLHGKKF